MGGDVKRVLYLGGLFVFGSFAGVGILTVLGQVVLR
jgi:hypothetical protein